MKTIWKFEINLTDEQAKVESDNSPAGRIIRIAGTGHEAPPGEYIDSVIQDGFVWHVFDGGDA